MNRLYKKLQKFKPLIHVILLVGLIMNLTACGNPALRAVSSAEINIKPLTEEQKSKCPTANLNKNDHPKVTALATCSDKKMMLQNMC